MMPSLFNVHALNPVNFSANDIYSFLWLFLVGPLYFFALKLVYTFGIVFHCSEII